MLINALAILMAAVVSVRLAVRIKNLSIKRKESDEWVIVDKLVGALILLITCLVLLGDK